MNYNYYPEQCGTCGAIIGGGCPESTPEEIANHRRNSPDDYTPEEIEEAEKLADR